MPSRFRLGVDCSLSKVEVGFRSLKHCRLTIRLKWEWAKPGIHCTYVYCGPILRVSFGPVKSIRTCSLDSKIHVTSWSLPSQFRVELEARVTLGGLSDEMRSWQSGNSREPLPLYMALCMTFELSSGRATLAFPPWDHYFACYPPRRAMFPCKTSLPAPRLRSTTPKGALPTWTVTLQSNHARWHLPTISGENYSVSSPPRIDLC